MTMGTLGDRIGRRRLLLAGAVAFGVASLAAAFAPTPELLIAARAALGIAGATLMPSALALVTELFPEPRAQGAAVATVFSAIMAGGALGPAVGGLLLAHFWWGSVFLPGVAVMALLLRGRPAAAARRARHRCEGAARPALGGAVAARPAPWSSTGSRSWPAATSACPRSPRSSSASSPGSRSWPASAA